MVPQAKRLRLSLNIDFHEINDPKGLCKDVSNQTDAKSIPQELSHIIPFMPNLPVIPIIMQGQREYGMFEHWRPYPWVLPIFEYENEGHLISSLSARVIEPAEKKVQEIRSK